MENTKDTQRNAYQLTINNPLDYGYSHNKIKKLLLNKFTTLQYFCLADEIGEEGTYLSLIHILPTAVRILPRDELFHSKLP